MLYNTHMISSWVMPKLLPVPSTSHLSIFENLCKKNGVNLLLIVDSEDDYLPLGSLPHGDHRGIWTHLNTSTTAFAFTGCTRRTVCCWSVNVSLSKSPNGMPGSVKGAAVSPNFPLLQLGRPQPSYVTQETDPTSRTDIRALLPCVWFAGWKLLH